MPDGDRTITLPLGEPVLDANDPIAAEVRSDLELRGVLAIDLIGAPGSGKTSLLETTLRCIRGRRRPAVLVGDLTTRRDGDRLARWCDQVVQISTGQGCHLDIAMSDAMFTFAWYALALGAATGKFPKPGELALVGGEPRTLPLKRMMQEYVDHRRAQEEQAIPGWSGTPAEGMRRKGQGPQRPEP